jgi:integrase
LARGAALDLDEGAVRVRAAFVERSTGEMLLGPPKSKAGRRIVAIPDAIIPALREHLAVFVKDESGALVFPGVKGGPLRRGNFNKLSGWPEAARAVGVDGCTSMTCGTPATTSFPERCRAAGPDGADGSRQRNARR